jgi:hypothetical protein
LDGVGVGLQLDGGICYRVAASMFGNAVSRDNIAGLEPFGWQHTKLLQQLLIYIDLLSRDRARCIGWSRQGFDFVQF